MQNFSYVGKDIFHTEDVKYNEKVYSIYALLKSYESILNNEVGDLPYSKEILVLKIKMGLTSSLNEKLTTLLYFLLNNVTSAELKSTILNQLSLLESGGTCDLALIELLLSKQGFNMDMFQDLLNLDVSTETNISLISDDNTMSVPIDASSFDIITLLDIIVEKDNTLIFSSFQSATNVLFYTEMALSSMSILLIRMNNGNNWSQDYILSQMKLATDEANRLMKKANSWYIRDIDMQRAQLGINNISTTDILIYNPAFKNTEYNKYDEFNKTGLTSFDGTKYYAMVGDLQSIASSTFKSIYDSDAFIDVRGQRELSAGLSDLIQQTNTSVFVSNLDLNNKYINSSKKYNDLMLNSVQLMNGVDNLTNDSISVLHNSIDTLNTDRINKAVNKSSAGLSGTEKTLHKLPYDVNSIAGLSGILVLSKDGIQKLLNDLSKLIFGSEGVDPLLSSLNNLLSKLNNWLKDTVGPLLKEITLLILKVTALIVAINALLCILKGFLCLLGSIMNAFSSAIDVASAVISKIASVASSVLNDLSSLGNLSNLTALDVMSIINDAISSSMDVMEEGVKYLLFSAGVAMNEINDAWDSFINSGKDLGCDMPNILDNIKESVLEELNNAYEEALNFIEEGLDCKLTLPIPNFSIPSLSGLSLPSMPSLPSLKIGC